MRRLICAGILLATAIQASGAEVDIREAPPWLKSTRDYQGNGSADYHLVFEYKPVPQTSFFDPDEIQFDVDVFDASRMAFDPLTYFYEANPYHDNYEGEVPSTGWIRCRETLAAQIDPDPLQPVTVRIRMVQVPYDPVYLHVLVYPSISSIFDWAAPDSYDDYIDPDSDDYLPPGSDYSVDGDDE